MNRKAWALAALGCCLAPVAQPRAQDGAGHMVAVEGGQVWTEACGKGAKTLLLLHDGVLHSAGYDGVWPELCNRFRVIRFDRRGYGRSPAPTVAFSPADDAAAVLKAEGVKDASVIGASEGGAIAIRLAERFPQMVDRLVLVGPSIDGLPVSDQFIALSEARIKALRKDGIAGAIANDPYVTAPDHPDARAKAAQILTANPQNILHKETRKRGPSARSLLPRIKAKTLILVGDHDAPDIHAWAGAAEALMPDAKRIVVPDAGHGIYLESPQTFTAIVEAFIG